MKLPVVVLCVSLYAAAIVSGRTGDSAVPEGFESPSGSLAAMFDMSRGLARDTNGDGVADRLVARLVVPTSPTTGDMDAATNIAGRLGFETSEAVLPVLLRDSDTLSAGTLPVLVGRLNARVVDLAARGLVSLKELQPGQGLVALVQLPSGGGPAIVVAGADDEGTIAAGAEFGARLPRLWGMTGVTLGMVEQQLAQFVKSKRVTAQLPFITSLVVDRDRRGIAQVVVRLPVSAAEAPRALEAFRQLDGAHRLGREPQVLNFINVGETAVDVVVGEQVAGRASVLRAGLNPRTLTPPIDPDELAAGSPGDRGRSAETSTAAGKVFDLTNTYSIDGWLGDGYADLIPDRTETTLVLGRDADAVNAAHIATRLGLESTGITLPITRAVGRINDPALEVSPILVGRDNPLVDTLAKIGRVRLTDLKPGQGLVQVVPRAFGGQTSTVVVGSDAAGTEAASRYLAERLPFVWDVRRGSLKLEDVATEMTRFLQARSGAGQASLMLSELDKALDGIVATGIQSADVSLFLESSNPVTDALVAARVREKLKIQTVTVKSRGMTDPDTVFDDTMQVPWEVADLRQRIKTDVLPKIGSGSTVDLEARVSEAPEFRKQLVDEISAQLRTAGAKNVAVRVRSAYKQGYSWMVEEVIPSLRGRGVRRIRVEVARQAVDLSKPQKFYEMPTRWINELYPVDEIIARELGVPTDAFQMELVDTPGDIYRVEAFDGAGKSVSKATFSPKTVAREYLEKFPGWARVTGTTGWLTAKVGDATVADARIETDPERVWSHYQAVVLPRIYDYVMKVTDGRPTPEKQPFHRDFDIDVNLSEPDYRIGVDEEQVSSLEALHEDLYFVTLDFFDAIGRTAVRQRLAAPGKILPIIHPERRGQPGTVRFLYAGNASNKPRFEISYKVNGSDKPVRVARDIPKIDVTKTVVQRAIVSGDRLAEIELRIDAKDDREAAMALDAFSGLARLQRAGAYKQSLSYPHVDSLALVVASKEASARATIPYSGDSAPSAVHTSTDKPTSRIVTWDHVISPEESEQIVGKLAAFPGVRAYRAGRSYRGRDTSVLEIVLPAGEGLSPGDRNLVSLAKLTAAKPTIFITGRQHANEVSSTSHILRLAELLVTDPAYKAILKRVNVVLHPVENPDGAAMAYDLQKLTPTHMLHAGRYSALGMDVGSQVDQADPLLPESLVRMRVWREWLPDIYLNPHGYPSHEWVQQFSGYVPPGFRSYWSSRGWYTSMNTLRDPRFPEHGVVLDRIRENLVREINADSDVRDMDLRAQARYRRWAYGFSPYVFTQEIYKDTAIYFSDPESGQLSGARRLNAGRAGGGGRSSMSSWPQTTYFVGMTESPDETAQGPWLDLSIKPGFSFLMANLRYLQEGKGSVELVEEDGLRDSATRTLLRVRPLKPGPAAAKPDSAVRSTGRRQ